MKLLHFNRSGISAGPVFVRLSRRNLAQWGFEAFRIGGLSLWSRTSAGELMIASYHPRSSITWIWSATLTSSGGRGRGYAPTFSREERARMAALYREGNPYAAKPSWTQIFVQRCPHRKGQWHDFYRLPFSGVLAIAMQDRMPRKGVSA